MNVVMFTYHYVTACSTHIGSFTMAIGSCNARQFIQSKG